MICHLDQCGGVFYLYCVCYFYNVVLMCSNERTMKIFKNQNQTRVVPSYNIMPCFMQFKDKCCFFCGPYARYLLNDLCRGGIQTQDHLEVSLVP